MLALKVEGAQQPGKPQPPGAGGGLSQTLQSKPQSPCVNGHGGQRLSLTPSCLLLTGCGGGICRVRPDVGTWNINHEAGSWSPETLGESRLPPRPVLPQQVRPVLARQLLGPASAWEFRFPLVWVSLDSPLGGMGRGAGADTEGSVCRQMPTWGAGEVSSDPAVGCNWRGRGPDGERAWSFYWAAGHSVPH